jgi:hypothetical protein
VNVAVNIWQREEKACRFVSSYVWVIANAVIVDMQAIDYLQLLVAHDSENVAHFVATGICSTWLVSGVGGRDYNRTHYHALPRPFSHHAAGRSEQRDLECVFPNCQLYDEILRESWRKIEVRGVRQ